MCIKVSIYENNFNSVNVFLSDKSDILIKAILAKTKYALDVYKHNHDVSKHAQWKKNVYILKVKYKNT